MASEASERVPEVKHDHYQWVSDFEYQDLIALPAVQQFCKALEIKAEAFEDFSELSDEFTGKLHVCTHTGCHAVPHDRHFDASGALFGFDVDGRPAAACDEHADEVEHFGMAKFAVFVYDGFDCVWQVAVMAQRGG